MLLNREALLSHYGLDGIEAYWMAKHVETLNRLLGDNTLCLQYFVVCFQNVRHSRRWMKKWVLRDRRHSLLPPSFYPARWIASTKQHRFTHPEMHSHKRIHNPHVICALTPHETERATRQCAVNLSKEQQTDPKCKATMGIWEMRLVGLWWQPAWLWFLCRQQHKHPNRTMACLYLVKWVIITGTHLNDGLSVTLTKADRWMRTRAIVVVLGRERELLRLKGHVPRWISYYYVVRNARTPGMPLSGCCSFLRLVFVCVLARSWEAEHAPRVGGNVRSCRRAKVSASASRSSKC